MFCGFGEWRAGGAAGRSNVAMSDTPQPPRHRTRRRAVLLAAGMLVFGSAAVYALGRGQTGEREAGRGGGQIAGIDFTQCPEAMGNAPCVARLLVDMAANDPAEALRTYTTAVGDGAEAFQECHGAHHILGEAAGAVLSIEELLEIDPGTCGQGFIHGAIAGYLNSIKDGTAASEGVAACETIATLSEDGGLYSNCRHALGHRIAVDGALFEDIDALCAGGGRLDRVSCVSGGFMQIFSDELGGRLLDMKTVAGRAERCNTTTDEVAEGCWVAIMTSVAAIISTVAPERMADLCLEGSAAAQCARSAGEAYGLYAVGEAENAVSALATWCAPMREQTETCLVGGAISIYNAGQEGVLVPEEILAAFAKDLPMEHREAVRFAIAQRTGS